ncbi:helix-turn-helix domain-containing protein [Streptomyces sp. NPDC054835]
MGVQNTIARPRTESRNSWKNHPPQRAHRRSALGGVIHDNVRHTTRFTVIGNHLCQHDGMSLVAIGLAVHIQSLPAGSPVDIKTLAARFPEGITRIANALRELELYGYLRRIRERGEDGRIVTRTISCNHPGRTGGSEDPEPGTEAERGPKPEAKRPSRRAADPPRRALPAVPQPVYPTPDLLLTAIDILAGLRSVDPRLYLSATDAEHLAPGIAAWLERELTPDAVRRVLTFDLPAEPLRRPAALLAHRLNAELPPVPPFRAPDEAPAIRHPLQNCDTCDHAYRASEPGTCGACTSAG